MKEDKLVIGGHEFSSRFILGSGKYNLDLIKAAVENAGAEIITHWHCVVQIHRAEKIYWIIFQRV